MKRLIYFVTILVLFNVVSVFASDGVSLSVNSLTITEGENATFTINAPDAAGRVDIKSNNTDIAVVSSAVEFLDKSSVAITVTAKKAGTTTINVVLSDIATYDGDVLEGTKTITINVKEKEKVTPTPTIPEPTPTPNVTPTPTPTPTPVAPKPQKEPEKKQEEVVNKTEIENPSTITEEKEELIINKFEIVGYDIAFNKDTHTYMIDVLEDTSQIFIDVEGVNLTITNDKIIDIKDKDEVKVSISNKDYNEEYTIKINRVKKEAKCDIKEEVKEEKEESKKQDAYMFPPILFFLTTLVFAALAFRIKENNRGSLSNSVGEQ